MTSLYDVDKFDPPPDQELICCICTCVLDNAVESQCRHVFCKYCIETWLQQHRTCPTCRKKVSQQQLRPILPLVHNMLNKLTMICDFKENGCLAKPMLEHYRSHVAKCGYEKVKCQFSKCASVLLRRELEEHEGQMCEFREILCQQQCGLQIPFKDMESHDCMQALKEHAEERNKHAQELEKRLQELITVQESLRHDVEELRQRVEREQSLSLDVDESTTSSWDFFDDDEDQNTTVFFESDSDNDVLAGHSSLLVSTSDSESDGPETVHPLDVNSRIQDSVIASTSNEPGTTEDQAVGEFLNEGEDTVNTTEGLGSSQNHLPPSSQRKMAIHDLIDNIISNNIESNNQQPFRQSSSSIYISSAAATASEETSHSQAGSSPLRCPTDQLVAMERVNNGVNGRIPTLTLSRSHPQMNTTAASLFGSVSCLGTTTEIVDECASQDRPMSWPVIDNSSSRYPITDLSKMVLPCPISNGNLLQETFDSTRLFPLTMDVRSNPSDYLHVLDCSKSACTTEWTGDRVSTTERTGDMGHSYSTRSRSASSGRTVFPSATVSSDRTVFPSATVSSDRTVFPSATVSSSRTVFPSATVSSSRTVFPVATVTSSQLEAGQGSAAGDVDHCIPISSRDVQDVIVSGDQDSSITTASKKRHNNDVMESTEPLVKNRRHDLSLNFSDEMVDELLLPNINVNINLALLDITEFADTPVAMTNMLGPTLQDGFKSGINPATSCTVISNQGASAYSRTSETCIVNPDASLSNPNCHQGTANSICLTTFPTQHNSYAINVTELDQTPATASLECQTPSATLEQRRPRSPSATSEQCSLRSASAMAAGQQGRSSLPANLVEDVRVPPSIPQLLSMYSGESDSSWNPDHTDQDASDESSLTNDAESDSSYEVLVPKPLSQIIEELAALSDSSDHSWTSE